jgi:hypothetical protein
VEDQQKAFFNLSKSVGNLGTLKLVWGKVHISKVDMCNGQKITMDSNLEKNHIKYDDLEKYKCQCGHWPLLVGWKHG